MKRQFLHVNRPVLNAIEEFRQGHSPAFLAYGIKIQICGTGGYRRPIRPVIWIVVFLFTVMAFIEIREVQRWLFVIRAFAIATMSPSQSPMIVVVIFLVLI